MIERVNILGPSACGKTRLACRIADALPYAIPISSVDNFSHTWTAGNHRQRAPEALFLEKVDEIIGSEAWILEGKFFSREAAERADMIVWMHRGLVTCLLNQWVRFIRNDFQSRRYGMQSNMHLSAEIFRQHVGLYEAGVLARPRKYTYEKAENFLSEWQEKVVRVRRNSDEQDLLQRLNRNF